MDYLFAGKATMSAVESVDRAKMLSPNEIVRTLPPTTTTADTTTDTTAAAAADMVANLTKCQKSKGFTYNTNRQYEISINCTFDFFRKLF